MLHILRYSALLLPPFIVYSLSFGSGFVYDDDTLIFGSPLPNSWSEVLTSLFREFYPGFPYFRPLAGFSLEAQRYLSGFNPPSFHAFNLLLVLGLTLALIWAFEPIIANFWKRTSLALIVVLHPITSACVYPISGRESLGAALFSTIVIGSFLRSETRWGVVGGFALLLGLSCRESTIAAPLVGALLAFGFCHQKRPYYVSKLLWVLLGFAAYLIWRHLAIGSTEGIKLTSNLSLPFLSLLYAVQSTFTPFYSLHYEPTLEAWFSPIHLCVALALLVLILALEARRTCSRNPLFLSFLAALSPTMNILRQETYFDERHLLLGLIVGALFLRKLPQTILFSLAVILGGISLERRNAYKDDITFTDAWLRVDPNNPHPLHQRGLHAIAVGDIQAGQDFLKRSLAQREVDIVYVDLGRSYLTSNRLTEAEESCEKALKIFSKSEDARACLAEIDYRKGSLGSALAHAEDVLSINPHHEASLMVRALVMKTRGDTTEALRVKNLFQKAVGQIDVQNSTIPTAFRKKLLIEFIGYL